MSSAKYKKTTLALSTAHKEQAMIFADTWQAAIKKIQKNVLIFFDVASGMYP